MKFVTYLLIICIAFTSCQNATPTDPKQQANKIDSIKHKLAPFFNGAWVVVPYMDSIKVSKSPYKSQTALPGIVEFNIQIEAPLPDSITIGAISIHEGTSLTIYFRPGKSPNSLPISLKDYKSQNDYFELGFSIEKGDTALSLYHFNQAGLQISEIKYSKITNHKEEAFQYQLNKTLFSGTYEMVDSPGPLSEIKLTNDGAITGMPNWNKYFVIADFVAAGDSATDEICFEIDTKNQICFAYRFDGDTLRLFKEIQDKNKEFQKLGDLEYVFVKKAK
ncbi:MAG TPA: hypothetical protein VGQ53_18925 [Chitinophagaceae bacterium]|jgi:hypothetical protein|nr:hypothetical protein [Chitinophagaceae bacterium]